MEAEALTYAVSFSCSIEAARSDVWTEYQQTETDTDAFYERTERYVTPADEADDFYARTERYES
jgi:hypothetical protein